MPTLMVTGTDTGVGKTIVTAGIAAAAQAAGLRVAVVKPVQTGPDCDASEVRRLADAGKLMTCTLCRYPDPLAPLAAARAAGRPAPQLEPILSQLAEISREHDLTLVEGAGGLLVPFGPDWTIADLAIALNAPAVVVTRAGLGTLNHTALTQEALARRGIPGILVVGAWPEPANKVHMSNLDDFRGELAGRVPAGAGQLAPTEFRRQAPGWFTPRLHGTGIA